MTKLRCEYGYQALELTARLAKEFPLYTTERGRDAESNIITTDATREQAIEAAKACGIRKTSVTMLDTFSRHSVISHVHFDRKGEVASYLCERCADDGTGYSCRDATIVWDGHHYEPVDERDEAIRLHEARCYCCGAIDGGLINHDKGKKL